MSIRKRLRALVLSVVAVAALTPAPAHAASVESGTIEGTLTTAKGAPVAGILIELRSAAGNDGTLPQTWTDEVGYYAIALPAGRYRVGFYFPATLSTQWVPQAARESAATWFTVRDGAVTVVDESLRPTGGLEITLLDQAGAGVPEFCVDAVGDLYVATGCTTTGTVLLTELPIGSYLLMATSDGGNGGDFADVTEDTVTPVELLPW